MRRLLTLNDIDKSLNSLPGWKREGAELIKTFRFPSYLAGIEFVRLLGSVAETLNHHPDLYVGWRKVTVKLTTHSEGGITSLDMDMAVNAERLSKAVEEAEPPQG